jgi:hypothetical protein
VFLISIGQLSVLDCLPSLFLTVHWRLCQTIIGYLSANWSGLKFLLVFHAMKTACKKVYIFSFCKLLAAPSQGVNRGSSSVWLVRTEEGD